jgi:hypothetical protein
MEGIADESPPFGTTQTLGYQLSNQNQPNNNNNNLVGSNQSNQRQAMQIAGQFTSQRSVSADSGVALNLHALATSLASSSTSGLGLGVGLPFTSASAHTAAQAAHHGKKRSYEEAEYESTDGPLEPMRHPYQVYPLHYSTSGVESVAGPQR